MRIYFHSLTHPKRAAKALRAYFRNQAEEFGPEYDVSLAETQQLVAQMLDYKDWHELQQVTRREDHPQSPYDEDCTREEVLRRLTFQISALRRRFSTLPDAELEKYALIARPTSGIRSDSFDVKTMNRIVPVSSEFHAYDQRTLRKLGQTMWEFHPSVRSDDTADEVFDIMELERNTGIEMLHQILERVPEHVQAASVLIADYCEVSDYEEAARVADATFPHLRRAFPPDFPASGPAAFEYYVISNRSFLRFYYWSAVAYHMTGRSETDEILEELIRYDFWDRMEGRALKRERHRHTGDDRQGVSNVNH